jgi:antitoxin HicB
MDADRPRKVPVVFYRTRAGTEVVRNWLRGLDESDRNREDDEMKKKKTDRSADELTTLDGFLKEEGKLEEFEAVAIKEVLAWQIAEAMKAQNLSRKRLAERMKTSRSQISRLLDPKDGNVTLATLQRAAKIVGRTLRLELV